MSRRKEKSQVRLFLQQLPFLLWLTVLWMLLWGQLTWLALLTGLVCAIAVVRVFRLNPIQLSGRVNAWRGLIFIVTFLAAVVRGSIIVAAQVLNPRREPGAAIVAVQLRSDDDLIMTHTAVTSSLIPGSLIVEADRSRRILYLHAIGVHSAEDADDMRRTILGWEARIVRAVGSRAQLAALNDAIAAAHDDAHHSVRSPREGGTPT
jgi:multicomponent Na+:H+ antiporter subunit E